MQSILVVEDDPSVAEMLLDILEDEGYSVALAADGEHALAQLAEGRYDLVITDLMMPRRDGRALRAAIAATPALAALPVVLMTAAANLTADDRRAFAAVLAKPFRLDTVLNVVAGCLGEGAEPPETAGGDA
jgi:CheY-like chemotaxis protein